MKGLAGLCGAEQGLSDHGGCLDLAIADLDCEMANEALSRTCGLWAGAYYREAVRERIEWAMCNLAALEQMEHADEPAQSRPTMPSACSRAGTKRSTPSRRARPAGH